MDPLAHTMVGASLAEVGLRRRTPLATATLVIGANLPDVDAIAQIWGTDASRHFRRGWTHGILAMAVLPLLLTGLILTYDRFLRRGREPAKPRAILLLAYVGLLTHPFLDWLNTYGIRLLMPFDGTWFYGDTLFIVDPLLWGTMGAGVVLARSRSRISAAGCIVLATATLLLVTTSDRAPLPIKVVWCAFVAAIALMRVKQVDAVKVARIGFALGAAYIAAMITTSALVERRARTFLAGRGVETGDVMAAPSAGDPFTRRIVAAAADGYHVFEMDGLTPSEPTFVPKGPEGPLVEEARRAPEVRGMVDWLRFPVYEVKPLPDGGHEVQIGDARRFGRGPLWRETVRLNRASPSE